MRRSVLAGLVLLGACNTQSPAEKAAADAGDIAAVERAQNQRPPIVPITPKPILFPDIKRAALYGPGCAFVAEGGGMGAVLLTENKRAAIKPKDEIVILASDPGSTPMPQGTWSRYVGKAYALTLTRADGGTDGAWNGKLVVTDPGDQIVYEASGQVQCKG